MNKLIKRIVTTAIVLIVSFMLVPTVSAHTPIGGGGDNESLATAMLVTEPTKSWVAYGDLHEGGEAQYFKFEIEKGQKIHLQLLITTAAEDADFAPGMILMGPGIQPQGSVPDYVEIAPETGQMVSKGVKAAQATYEAFAPSAYFNMAEITLAAPASGTYYVAIQNDTRGGHYGLAIGNRETFTLVEWLTTPLFFPTIYGWERQSLPVIYGPGLLTILLGVVFLIRRQRAGKRLDVSGWMGAAAGILFLVAAITTTFQMFLSLSQSAPDGGVVVTIVIITLQMITGLLAVWLSVSKSGRWTVRSRISLALIGVFASLVWAGYLVGPLAAILAACIPAKKQ